jgi:hypothetical protein
LILFYLVFQVNFMSLAENWRKELTELANDRSTLRSCALENVRQPRRTCALENVRQACGCALGERSPRPANVRTRGQQTQQARGQLVLATSRLQDETNGLD